MPKSSPIPRVVLATGGTGGHLFPAIAIAHILTTNGFDATLVTDKRAEPYLKRTPDISTEILAIPSYKGGIIPLLKFATALGIYIVRMLLWYLRKNPVLTIGFGGYPSVAALIASILTRTPLILHEQNAHIGRVTRWLSPWTKRIIITLPLVPAQEKKYRHQITWIGPILRPALHPKINSPYTPPTATSPIHLFIVGGSQGAKSFSTLIPNALTQLPLPIRSRLRVVQQCRTESIDDVRALYATSGIHARLQPFFDDIGTEIQKAHLVITRAGASTITEIAAIGRPALLIPLPTAMDDHQRLNAEAVIRLNGGWMFDEKHASLSTFVDQMKKTLSSPKKLEKAAHNIHYLYKAHADKNLMILIKSIVQI